MKEKNEKLSVEAVHVRKDIGIIRIKNALLKKEIEVLKSPVEK
jgi:hypothetical protein